MLCQKGEKIKKGIAEEFSRIRQRESQNHGRGGCQTTWMPVWGGNTSIMGKVRRLQERFLLEDEIENGE